MSWLRWVLYALVLAGSTIGLARLIDSVSVDPKARTNYHKPCFPPQELCSEGVSCQYFVLRDECLIHEGRYRQFRQYEAVHAIMHTPELDEALAKGKIEMASCGIHTEAYHRRYGCDTKEIEYAAVP